MTDDQRRNHCLFRLGWMLIEFRHYAEINWGWCDDADTTETANDLHYLVVLSGNIADIAIDIQPVVSVQLKQQVESLARVVRTAYEQYRDNYLAPPAKAKPKRNPPRTNPTQTDAVAHKSKASKKSGKSSGAKNTSVSNHEPTDSNCLLATFRDADRTPNQGDHEEHKFHEQYLNNLTSGEFTSDHWLELDRASQSLWTRLPDPCRFFFILGQLLAFGGFPVYTINLLASLPKYEIEFCDTLRREVANWIRLVNNSYPSLQRALPEIPFSSGQHLPYFDLRDSIINSLGAAPSEPGLGYLGLIVDRERRTIRRPSVTEDTIERLQITPWRVFLRLFDAQGAPVKQQDLLRCWGSSSRRSETPRNARDRLYKAIQYLRSMLERSLQIEIETTRQDGYALK